jgi:hypothetical protein
MHCTVLQNPDAVDAKALLLDIHRYFLHFSAAEFRQLSDDKSVRMVKTVLHSMCKQHGWPLLETLAVIPAVSAAAEPPMVVKYVHLNLKHLDANGLLPGQDHAAPVATASPPVATAKPNAEPALPQATGSGEAYGATAEMQGLRGNPVGVNEDSHVGTAPAQQSSDREPGNGAAEDMAVRGGGSSVVGTQPLQPSNVENVNITKGLNIPEHLTPQVWRLQAWADVACSSEAHTFPRGRGKPPCPPWPTRLAHADHGDFPQDRQQEHSAARP